MQIKPAVYKVGVNWEVLAWCSSMSQYNMFALGFKKCEADPFSMLFKQLGEAAAISTAGLICITQSNTAASKLISGRRRDTNCALLLNYGLCIINLLRNFHMILKLERGNDLLQPIFEWFENSDWICLLKRELRRFCRRQLGFKYWISDDNFGH